jgi:hypothetical protein
VCPTILQLNNIINTHIIVWMPFWQVWD